MNTTSKFTLRAALALLVMMLTTATAWATVDVTVNVTGSGSVSIGNQTATADNPFTTSVDDGASVTLTFAPNAGNIVTSAKLSYKPSEDGTAEDDIAISGSTATFQMPNDIWNGTGVTINVTFGDGLAGGADEASAVALTDATVSNLAGGYYKVERDISFDHTLNLLGNTYLVIASGAKMTVSSSEYGINGGSYALNVLGEGTLNVTTTGSWKIAVSVSSYTQSGCSVNLTTSYMGMRCSDSFNISGGSFKTNGSEGIWPNNDVNISGGKLEASNIDANINLSYSNTDDYIKVDNYTSGKTMTIANGQTFTDGTNNYSGTITNLSPLNGKKLFPFVYKHLTVRDATCTEVGIKQECWQRSSDGKYFSDENGTTELNASDVETPMIAHNGVPHEATDTHIAYWQCSMCSKYFSEEGCTTEITEEDTKIYRTITIDGSISGLVTSNVDKAVAGTTVTLTVSHLIDASTLRVNDGNVALTDAGNGTYTFKVPAADVTVTASTATTYSVNLPANMEIVSATTTADGDGKYISGTVVTFKASFSYTASNVSDGANTLTADGSGNYSVTVGTADITVTATIGHSSNIDLSQAPGDFTVVDGDVLTGSTSHTVTIANGASITLNDATISGGIVCEGTAEITLVGTNGVSVSAYNKAGIQIGGSGTTFTIKGNGSLNVTGGSQSAGIGLGRTWDANAMGGSIVIECGTVTASGEIGIGTGRVGSSMTAHMDGIIIKGGTVNASLGKSYIYTGSSVTIGAIKIYDTIDKVDASKITESVTYMHVENETETNVTASASTYFSIIEDGDRRIIEKKDDTDYSITITDNTEHGTIACAATTAKYGDKVTITATPDFGYRLSNLVVKDAQNKSVASMSNSFTMPQSNVTVSAVFEQGTHGTTEFAWGYAGPEGYVTDATIYDGVTTVNLQQERSCNIRKNSEYSYSKFLLDNDTYDVTIPYAGGTGAFQNGNGTNFCLGNDATAGFYDITMTDAGNGKWSVSILKTAAAIDDVPDQTYTGSAITPEPLVIAGSLSLTKGTDYTYSYENNINVGTATVTVTFQGTYESLGSVEKEFTIAPWSGTGDSEDPYMIYNKDQLLLLAHRVNGTNDETANTYEGMYFKLGADITFSHDADETDDYAENYEAIGTYIDGTYRYFNGDFDGDGHTVSGIRIRKTTGSSDYQGLFGLIDSGADIHDVHLTDARITGYNSVGGIVGYNNEGYIMRCSVTDSYITATDNWNYGTICGWNGGTLTNNYYHGCTVDGTAVTSGAGSSGADITDNNGALPAYAIALGANITTPPGTFAGQTVWLDTPPVDARLAPENGFTLAGNHYFASGYVFTPGSTLASGAEQGYTPRATLGGQTLDLYTPTGDTDPLAGKAIARFTVTADCDGKTLDLTLISTREPVTVAYIKADGTTDEASAIALDGHETVDGNGDVRLAAGTYYVGTDIAYANQIVHDGNITLILANGKTMTLNGNTTGIAIGYNLTIYGQSLDDATAGTLRYNGTWEGIHAYYYEQHSGNVSITTTGSGVFGINADVTLRGGTLTVTANGTDACAIYGYTHSILGGQLTATATGDGATGIYAGANDGTAITLGWTRPADRITASSISTYDGTVAVADGKALTDGSGHIYTGTLSADDLDAIAALGGKTPLRPCLALADAADNTAAITDHAGQTLAVALSGRTLFKDGKWNTLCLPFALSAEQIAAHTDFSGATLMELDTDGKNGFDTTDGTLYLTFKAATAIAAGVPYLVKWDAAGTDFTSPTFSGATIDATASTTVSDADDELQEVQMVGCYSPVPVVADDKSILFLGDANTLYYSSIDRDIRSCRAYFSVPYIKEHASAKARAFRLDFGDGEQTGITTTNYTNFTNSDDAWYSLDGRKLDGKPTKSGLYIHGCNKVVVK